MSRMFFKTPPTNRSIPLKVSNRKFVSRLFLGQGEDPHGSAFRDLGVLSRKHAVQIRLHAA